MKVFITVILKVMQCRMLRPVVGITLIAQTLCRKGVQL